MKELQVMLHLKNQSVRELKSSYGKEVAQNSNNHDFRTVRYTRCCNTRISANVWQCNALTISEIYVVISDNEETTRRDIVIEGK